MRVSATNSPGGVATSADTLLIPEKLLGLNSDTARSTAPISAPIAANAYPVNSEYCALREWPDRREEFGATALGRHQDAALDWLFHRAACAYCNAGKWVFGDADR